MNMMNQSTPESANNSFYQAFEELSIENMDKIWSHSEASSCVHPGWELVVGWIAIIICLEDIHASVNGKGVKFSVVATNIFEEAEDKWFLTHHHGSALSYY